MHALCQKKKTYKHKIAKWWNYSLPLIYSFPYPNFTLFLLHFSSSRWLGWGWMFSCSCTPSCHLRRPPSTTTQDKYWGWVSQLWCEESLCFFLSITLAPLWPNALISPRVRVARRKTSGYPGKFEFQKNNKSVLFILLIYFWLCWVFTAMWACSLVVLSQGYSSLQCPGFSLWWLLLLWSTGSRASGLQQLQLPGSRAHAK